MRRSALALALFASVLGALAACSSDDTTPAPNAAASGDAGDAGAVAPSSRDGATDVTVPPSDAGADAETDAGSDAGVDAGSDAGVDAGSDAGADAAAPPEFCSTDWCFERPRPFSQFLGGGFARSPKDLWLFGNRGTIERYDGTAFSYTVIDQSEPMRAVWASGPNDAWAASASGKIFHFDGASWATSTTVAPNMPSGIFGTSASDVWMVGRSGMALHYDGATWTTVDTKVGENLNAIWGASSSEIWAVGAAGRILRWDGTAWSADASNTAQSLNAISGAGPSDAWAVGNGGTLLHWDGVSWSAIDPDGDKSQLLSVLALPGGELYVASYWFVLHRAANVWTKRDTTFQVSALLGMSPSDLYLAGSGASVEHFDGKDWQLLQGSGASGGLVLGGVGDTTFAVGAPGYVLMHDGSSWTEQSLPASPSGLTSVWAASPTNAWAVGGSGRIVHYDGATWTEVASPSSMPQLAIHGTSSSNIWTAGASGRVMHYDGMTWTESVIDDQETYRSIWAVSPTEAWLVGYQGVIRHLKDGAWTKVDGGTNAKLDQLWASGPNDVWAVGDSGVVLRWQGAAFAPAGPPGAVNEFSTVFGFSPSDVWIAGYAEGWRWDGAKWTSRTDMLGISPLSLWGKSPSSLRASGGYGSILRHR